MKRLRALLPLLLLIATGAVLFFSGALRHLDPRHLAAEHAHLHHLAAASPWLARMSYLGIMVLAVASGVPGLVLIAIAGGLIFGMVEATVLSTLGLVLGSLLLFLAARYALGAGERPAPRLAAKIRAGFLHHPASYTLFLRLVPVFPFGGVTLGLAWLRCPLWLFMAATAVGGLVIFDFHQTPTAVPYSAQRRDTWLHVRRRGLRLISVRGKRGPFGLAHGRACGATV